MNLLVSCVLRNKVNTGRKTEVGCPHTHVRDASSLHAGRIERRVDGPNPQPLRNHRRHIVLTTQINKAWEDVFAEIKGV